MTKQQVKRDEGLVMALSLIGFKDNGKGYMRSPWRVDAWVDTRAGDLAVTRNTQDMCHHITGIEDVLEFFKEELHND